VPAAIARAYYVAMQPPCGPTFVSVPIDDWTILPDPWKPAASAARFGPDPEAMHALTKALAKSKALPLWSPRCRSSAGVDLMGEVAEKTKAAVWVSRSRRVAFSRRRHPQFAGFLHASPGDCPMRCANMI